MAPSPASVSGRTEAPNRSMAVTAMKPMAEMEVAARMVWRRPDIAASIGTMANQTMEKDDRPPLCSATQETSVVSTAADIR